MDGPAERVARAGRRVGPGQEETGAAGGVRLQQRVITGSSVHSGAGTSRVPTRPQPHLSRKCRERLHWLQSPGRHKEHSRANLTRAEAAAVISELKIRNFKSLESVDLKLGNLNLLVGANASGKSNFLDAL